MKKILRFLISSNKFLSLLQKKTLKVLQNFSKKPLVPVPKKFFLGPTPFSGNEKHQTRFLCAVSGGQDSIITLFILFHSISNNRLELNSQKQDLVTKMHFWERDKHFLVRIISWALFEKRSFSNQICWSQKGFFWEKERKQEIEKMSILEVVYCQHFWQPKNFFCSQLIFQTSFQIKAPYTLILSTKNLVSENRSRVWRKKSFSRFLQLEKISTLITGHTQTDRVEKNLSNFFRGTSPKSLENSAIVTSKKLTGIFFPTLIFEPRVCQFHKTPKSRKFKNQFLFRPQKTNLNFFAPFPKNVFGINKYSFIKTSTREKNTFVFFKNCSQKKVGKSKLGPDPKNEFDSKSMFGPKNISKNFLFGTVDSKNSVFVTVWSQKASFWEGKGKETGLNGIFGKGKDHFKEKFFRSNCKKKSFSVPFIQISTCPKFKEKQFVFFYSSATLLINLISFFNPVFSYSFCLVSKPLKNKLVYLKPLETINRFTISKLITLSHYPINQDMTNFSATFYRNKIRHQLIPFIHLLLQNNFEYLLTTFISLVSHEHQQIENELSELNIGLKLIKGKYFKNKNYSQFFHKRIKISSSLILKNQILLKGTLLKNGILKYREIDLNFSQTSQLKTFV